MNDNDALQGVVAIVWFLLVIGGFMMGGWILGLLAFFIPLMFFVASV